MVNRKVQSPPARKTCYCAWCNCLRVGVLTGKMFVCKRAKEAHITDVLESEQYLLSQYTLQIDAKGKLSLGAPIQ